MPTFTQEQLAHMTDLARLHAAVEQLEERGWTVRRAIPDPFSVPPTGYLRVITWLEPSETRGFDDAGRLVRTLYLHLTGVTRGEGREAAAIITRMTGYEALFRGRVLDLGTIRLLPRAQQQ